MERCTLCGGRLVNGRCRECGLDNTKNDKKYHLNTHNEKSAALFHRGDCEDHLNRDNGYGDNWPWKRKKQPATAGLEHYQRKGAAASSSAETFAGATAGTTTDAGSFAGASAGADTAAARTSTSSASTYVPQGTAQSLSGSTAAGSASAKSTAARRKELKKRSQTGTVRKKSGTGRFIRLVLISLILVFVVFPIVAQKVIEYRRSNGGFSIFGGSSVSDAGPEKISWDEDDERYYGIRLDPGVYEVGYDIPAGEYQLCCAGESADVYWQDADADRYDYRDLTLYSPDRQASYRDFWDEDCPFYQYSDRITLSEGMLFVVEASLDPEGVELEGLTDPGAVCRERAPQPGLEAVQVKEGLIAGEDFPVGVYNLMLDDADDEYSYGSISVQIDRTGKTINAGANSNYPVFWHIPFTGGEKIRVTYQNDAGGAHLVPSF